MSRERLRYLEAMVRFLTAFLFQCFFFFFFGLNVFEIILVCWWIFE